MTTKRNLKLADNLRLAYLEYLKKHGEQILYKRTVGEGLIAIVDNPEIDFLLLDYSDSFFTLYRKTGEEEYFTLGKILRRAAHVIYRQIMKQNENRLPNNRFLYMIQ